MFQINEPCFITINKHKGISSAHLLNKIKKELKIKKAGFCGTLDPLAEGVIVVAVSKATKLISLITDSDKTYSGKMILGFKSSSCDTDTELVPTGVSINISETMIVEIIERFSGVISQTPPGFSAVKIDGVRAYKLARKGEFPEIKERKVNIKTLFLKKENDDTIFFKVECSKGTYIRSLVSDIGKYIGCGAVLTELKRERVGNFSIQNSVSLDEIKNNNTSLKKAVTDMDSFFINFNSIEVDEKVFMQLKNGIDISQISLNLSDGLNYIKYNGKPSFILEKRNGESFYYVSLRD